VKQTLDNHKYTEYFRAFPYNSGYFMCVKLKEGLDGEKIRNILLEKYDTGIININNVIRIAFSSVSEKDIPQLFENIYNACKDFSTG
jgi:DNA-binding transcriptional MocR family regulator